VPTKSHYEFLLKHLGWTDAGQIIASGKSIRKPDQDL
jgi:hypothetical protein